MLYSVITNARPSVSAISPAAPTTILALPSTSQRAGAGTVQGTKGAPNGGCWPCCVPSGLSPDCWPSRPSPHHEQPSPATGEPGPELRLTQGSSFLGPWKPPAYGLGSSSLRLPAHVLRHSGRQHCNPGCKPVSLAAQEQVAECFSVFLTYDGHS